MSMLRWSENQRKTPVVIRIPGGNVLSNPEITLPEDYSEAGYEIFRSGSRVALIGVGGFLPIVTKAADMLAADGVEATVINPRQVSTLNTATLDTLRGYDVVITAEDGILDGGYGQKVASYFGNDPVKVINLGLPKQFLNRYNAKELQHSCGMTPEQIAATAFDNIKK